MRISYVLTAVLALVAFDASAEKACLTNYSNNGSFFAGRTFTTWDVVPGVAPADALKRIQIEGVKAGLKVASIDKDLGMLTFEQIGQLNGGQITLPWNVLVEADGKGSKITVTKSTPPAYATGEDFQQKSMCGVIEAVAPAAK
ncbi:hypothetical protein [Stenotrophomonas cyclobalanopsidis]|uniref:hypothetical protein n=1 Tax=Stenotrophomonas cyclobalanopsidis TaxID=2771362 RepID=UPI001FEBB1E0|nr:hypothetical protein [Stenotrophomonas cyclobalanopsidis]